MTIDWGKTSQLSRPYRVAKVEGAARALVTERGADALPLSTADLAALLAPPEHQGWVMDILSKVARYATGFAHHDGEAFSRFGRTMKRWRWYLKGEEK